MAALDVSRDARRWILWVLKETEAYIQQLLLNGTAVRGWEWRSSARVMQYE